MKSSRLSRVIQLLTALQSGQSYSAEDLSGILKISTRMVFRDLNELRKVGVPCSFNNKDRGYRIDPDFFFSTPGLESNEALGLLLLAHKARNHIRFPFKESMLHAALKIESELPEKTKQFCRNALKKIYIKADPQETLDLLDKKFSQFLEAILNKRIITIKYISPSENECIESNFCPYHLMYNDYAWYVIGKMEVKNEVCVLKLNHISEFRILNKGFLEDASFDISDFIGRAWSMKPEGRLYNVKLKFLPEAAHSVANVQWHSTQKVTFNDDGSMIMEFRVDGLNEITWWILSYGDKVQVLAPDVLRVKITKIVQNMLKQNEIVSTV